MMSFLQRLYSKMQHEIFFTAKLMQNDSNIISFAFTILSAQQKLKRIRHSINNEKFGVNLWFDNAVSI